MVVFHLMMEIGNIQTCEIDEEEFKDETLNKCDWDDRYE